VDGGDRYSIRLADVRVSKSVLWMLRWGTTPWALWVLRERRHNQEKVKNELTAIAESIARYLVEARRLQIEGQQVAKVTRRLTWAVVGLTLVNAAFVAYSALN
jgi:hypothetical protein